MPDQLDVLRQDDHPIEPDAVFRAELRYRLARELGTTPPSPSPPGETVPTASPDATYIPERLHAVTPYLAVADARAAIEWYSDIFGATLESEPIVMPDGRIGHVEVRIADSVLMLADEFEDINVLGPNRRGGTTVSFVIYVADVDEVYRRAVEARATPERPVADQFHGSRAGWIIDPWGHRWNVSTPLR
jgi:uncharacterized glyoxalase superfamily protein PhnB